MRIATALSLVAGAAAFRNVAYFAEWTPGLSGFNVANLDASRLTHVNYAFAIPAADGSLAVDNTTAAFGTVVGSDLGPLAVQGNFGQLFAFKKANRNIKVALSVGGWGNSDAFPTIAASPSLRATFITNVVQLLADLGLDGVDLDWEYPSGPHCANFRTLLQEFRAALDQLPFRAELTIAVAGYPTDITPYLADICATVDAIYIMSYDYTGTWSRVAGNMAPLYTDASAPDDFRSSADQGVQYYANAKCPKSKLVLGLPLYGTSFEKTAGIYQSFSAPTTGSYEANGNWVYNSLPLSGMNEVFDKNTKATSAYDPKTRMWVSYDGPLSAQAKANYIKEQGLGGAMYWEIAGDAPAGSNRSIVTQVVNVIGAGTLDKVPNTISYPTSLYSNIRGAEATTLQFITSQGLAISEWNGNLYASTARHNLNERFQYDPVTFQLRSLSGNSCIDAYADGSKAAGYTVHTWTCDASNGNQRWKVDAQNHRIVHKTHPNLCLDVDPSNKAGVVQVWQCHALNSLNANQWLGLPEEHVYLQNKDLRFAGNSKDQSVGFAPAAAVATQTWVFDNVAKTVALGSTGLCLDAYQGCNGGAVHLWACSATNGNQKWTYDSSTQQLRHVSYAGMCLDLGGTSGASPHLWSCHKPTDPWYSYQQLAYLSADYAFLN
ncbi:endochitinase 1 [Achlya hypogyna]|uniref:Endochitinase 1 n=1 Tax=Achlya hypogyna TaxID=1202772 RepID=A0A1V9YYS2_ACHHY|nr:endochitinase 1 [Achlya hypogyna]